MEIENDPTLRLADKHVLRTYVLYSIPCVAKSTHRMVGSPRWLERPAKAGLWMDVTFTLFIVHAYEPYIHHQHTRINYSTVRSTCLAGTTHYPIEQGFVFEVKEQEAQNKGREGYDSSLDVTRVFA